MDNLKYMKKIACLLTATVGFVMVSGQTPLLDSIKTEIQKHPAKDSVRMEMMMDYVIAAVNENTSQLLPYLNELITISKEKAYKRGIQFGYMTAQIYYSDRGDFTRSMLYADSAFLYLKGDTALKVLQNIAYLHNNLGGDYYKLGDYQQSLSHYNDAAKMLEKYRPEALASVYSGMAEVYEQLLQPDKAIAYDEKAIAIAEKSGNKSSIAKRRLNYIGRFINQKQFDRAEVLLKKIEPLVMELQESFAFVYFYQNRGYVFQHKKLFDKAIADFKKAYNYAKYNDDKYQQLGILNPLTDCLMDAGRMTEANLYLDTLLLQSGSYQMQFGRLHAYTNLAKWNDLSGDYKTANIFLQKKMALADSINSSELKDKIAVAETRFKVQGKDNEIKILQNEKNIQQLKISKKNILNYVLAGSAGALLLIFFLTYRNYHHKQKLQQQRINELETEKILMATAAVLKGEEQERTRLAKDLHDGLGGMLSGIKYSLNTMKGNLILTPDNAQAFERSMDMLDSSIQEMRRVAHNLMPEALVKFGLDTALKDFCSDINNSGALQVTYQAIGFENIVVPQTTAITIYRIVQELLNNTIKHAGATQAIVQLSKTSNIISLTVEDDGKGFDTSILEIAKGMGWENIRHRVDFLKGKLDVNSQAGKGTSVLVELDG
jgi:two-component system, NarL family, sensor kinase